MFPSARRRPGTSPSFWRSYHQAQLRIAAATTGMRATGAAKALTTQQLILEYERTLKPAAAHSLCGGR
jgi:hypothetical protein